MGRLVKHLALFVSILCVFLLALVKYLEYQNVNYRPFRNKFNFYLSSENNYQTYILGDSLAEFGFDARLLKKSVNLAYQGGGYQSAIKALRLSGIDLHEKNLIVVISQAALNDSRITNRFLALIDDFLVGDWGFILRHWNYKIFEHLNTLFTCQFFHCSYFNITQQQFRTEDRGFFVQREKVRGLISEHKKFALQYQDYLKHFSARTTLLPSLERSLAELKEQGVNVTIVFPPYRKDAREQFVNKQSLDLKRAVEKIGEQYSFKVIDLSLMKGVTDHDFMDPVHLNNIGAKKFTEAVISNL